MKKAEELEYIKKFYDGDDRLLGEFLLKMDKLTWLCYNETKNRKSISIKYDDDLKQECRFVMLSLIRKRKFDPLRGFGFSAFAKPYIVEKIELMNIKSLGVNISIKAYAKAVKKSKEDEKVDGCFVPVLCGTEDHFFNENDEFVFDRPFEIEFEENDDSERSMDFNMVLEFVNKNFSEREKKVFFDVASGKTMKQIGADIDRSHQCASNIFLSVMEKLKTEFAK